ncbi:MAG: HAMP domain-containing histidine kinase [Candidatus Aminicenantes bacterium]|nr:HAMP domain-containing histidine kinase [Candidatus Aminicenantes bacterium]
MDTGRIKKVFSLFDTVVAYEQPRSFRQELERQCSYILVTTSILAMIAWIPFVQLDKSIYPEIPGIVLIKLGFALIGALAFVLHFTPFFRKRSYLLLFMITCYFVVAAGTVLGIVKADPVYMGGYAMLVLILPVIPFRKIHSLLILSVSLALFFLIGLSSGMTFDSEEKLYGLLNLAAAAAVSVVAIFIHKNIRKVSFDKNQTIQETNEKLKEATMKIVQVNEDLKSANRLKSKLLEIVAHDLKNPLQVIIGYTDLLQEKLKEDRYAFEKLNRIYKSSDNMIKLISKLLKALTIDSGRLVLNKSDVDMAKLTESVIADNRHYLEKKKQTINYNAGESCVVHADETLLKEVIDNLLNNAVKFSPPGKSIWVSLNCDDSMVTFKIRDEGPGFDKSDKEKMFQRFRKLSAQPTGGESSTGLGLAIVKDLIELHIGEISVESKPGQGSTFIVKLPCSQLLLSNPVKGCGDAAHPPS